MATREQTDEVITHLEAASDAILKAREVILGDSLAEKNFDFQLGQVAKGINEAAEMLYQIQKNIR